MPIKSFVGLVRGERDHSRPEFFEGVATPARILVFVAAVVAYFSVSALCTWLLPDVITRDLLGEVIPRIIAVASAALVFMTSERLLAHTVEATEHPSGGAGSP